MCERVCELVAERQSKVAMRLVNKRERIERKSVEHSQMAIAQIYIHKTNESNERTCHGEALIS